MIETELNDAIARNFGNLNTTRDYTLSFQGVLSIIVINKMHSKSNIDNTANMISEVSIMVERGLAELASAQPIPFRFLIPRCNLKSSFWLLFFPCI